MISTVGLFSFLLVGPIVHTMNSDIWHVHFRIIIYNITRLMRVVFGSLDFRFNLKHWYLSSGNFTLEFITGPTNTTHELKFVMLLIWEKKCTFLLTTLP